MEPIDASFQRGRQVKADVRRRMRAPHRQSEDEIAQELGIHVITLKHQRSGLGALEHQHAAQGECQLTFGVLLVQRQHAEEKATGE